mmetsp:Transcript_2276/g.5193  ORF Transcript_2276/g.5193 Transcript_2276/m.5193 type:complete len:227 (-) Transcript_2276:2977-3657(-)
MIVGVLVSLRKWDATLSIPFWSCWSIRKMPGVRSLSTTVRTPALAFSSSGVPILELIHFLIKSTDSCATLGTSSSFPSPLTSTAIWIIRRMIPLSTIACGIWKSLESIRLSRRVRQRSIFLSGFSTSMSLPMQVRNLRPVLTATLLISMVAFWVRIMRASSVSRRRISSTLFSTRVTKCITSLSVPPASTQRLTLFLTVMTPAWFLSEAAVSCIRNSEITNVPARS